MVPWRKGAKVYAYKKIGKIVAVYTHKYYWKTNRWSKGIPRMSYTYDIRIGRKIFKRVPASEVYTINAINIKKWGK